MSTTRVYRPCGVDKPPLVRLAPAGIPTALYDESGPPVRRQAPHPERWFHVEELRECDDHLYNEIEHHGTDGLVLTWHDLTCRCAPGCRRGTVAKVRKRLGTIKVMVKI